MDPRDLLEQPRREVRNLRAVGYDDCIFTLIANDDGGELRILVGRTLWEDLRLSAPDYSDDMDRRHFALDEVAFWAGIVPVERDELGRFVLLPDDLPYRTAWQQ